MAKKVILKDENLIEVMPITRAELVLDSAGNQALRSREFLATDTQPGLTNLHYVSVSKEEVPAIQEQTVQILQLKAEENKVFPVTSSNAVLVTTNTSSGTTTTTTLTNVLNEIQLDIKNSKIVLDDRPTEGNTTHSVSSDGIFQELKETVGNIQILLQNV